ncbi:HNH endonuclease signature motif containing protein [Pseudomonas fulva]|uniref:HNH endonuclease signature motif containing protein n=1 Tax=Pseudomonas fulva TaxID=47880 RepID=UPI0018A8C0CE|nr:HNH endonuclease signature motif containing protein [Pseudomonas fulva]MBF8774032.1 HNH endonuclease [Pseudomonas fulva]
MPTFISRSRKTSDDLEAISSFIKQKQKNWKVLRSEFRNLGQMFENYLSAVEDPVKYISSRRYSVEAAGAFYFLYDSEARCVAYVDEFRELAESKLGGCPYCGLPRNITLDHFLPRKLNAFPEYSILSKNLVPACSGCQGKKSDYYHKLKRPLRIVRGARFKPKTKLIKDRKQCTYPFRVLRGNKNFGKLAPLRILHPYLDTFLKRPVLRISPSADAEVFYVRACGSLTKFQRVQVEFHLKKLGVSSRSGGVVRSCRNAVIRDLSINKVRLDHASVKAELPRLLRSAIERANMAVNAIEPAYIRSLISHSGTLDDLIEHAKTRAEPNVLACAGVIL